MAVVLATKVKINWTTSKLKTSVYQRTQPSEEQPMEWERIVANHISNKELIPRT